LRGCGADFGNWSFTSRFGRFRPNRCRIKANLSDFVMESGFIPARARNKAIFKMYHYQRENSLDSPPDV